MPNTKFYSQLYRELNKLNSVPWNEFAFMNKGRFLRPVIDAFNKSSAYQAWLKHSYENGCDMKVYIRLFLSWGIEAQPHELEAGFNEHEIMELMIEGEAE